MKRIVTITLAVLLCGAVLSAHPGTALVTDASDNVYFAYWGGTWKLNPTGRAEQIHPNDLHFLAVDIAGRFANAKLPDAIRITPTGKPAIFAFPEHPAVFHTDGNLYEIPWSPGRLLLERVTPDGRKSTFVNSAIDPRIARKPGRHEGG